MRALSLFLAALIAFFLISAQGCVRFRFFIGEEECLTPACEEQYYAEWYLDHLEGIQE